jgi:ribose transport system permease protein
VTNRNLGRTLGLDRFSGFYLLALFIVIFSVWEPRFFPTMDTVHSVAASQAPVAMLAIAVLCPLAAGAYDLSVGANMNLAAVLAALLQTQYQWGIVPAIVFTVVVSTLLGGVNAILVVVCKINSFIATLGSATIIGAIMEIVTNESQPTSPTSSAWLDLTQSTFLGFDLVVVYLIVLVVIAWWALEHTPAGRYLYAIGGNSEAARLAGVRVGWWTAATLVFAGLISGVAGVLYSSFLGPSLTFGQGLLLPAFAAAFLGATQIKPNRFNVFGTILAVYVLATGVTGLQLVTGQQWLNDMFNGVALVLAVGFAGWQQRRVIRSRLGGVVRKSGADDGQRGSSVSGDRYAAVVQHSTSEGLSDADEAT